MIADRSFDRHNQLTDPFTGRRPPADGVAGHRVLVNGAYMPHHRVTRAALPAAPAQRLRLPRLQRPPLQRRADDPDRHRQRPDAEARAAQPDPARSGRAGGRDRRLRRARRGESVELRSGPRHDGHDGAGARPYVGALMQFRVGSRRMPDRTRVPRKLRPLPGWTRHVSHKPDHTWTISIGGAFNHDLADQRPDLQPGPRRRLTASSTRPSPGRSSTAPASPT